MTRRWIQSFHRPVIALMLLLTVSGGVAAQAGTPIPYTPGVDLKQLTGKVTADGSSTVGPITEAAAEEFGLDARKVEVTVDISGTGGGFKRFCAGEIDLQNASRAVKEEEIELCREAGIDYYVFEIAYDGLVLAIHPDNDWVSCLTVDQLHAIWGPESKVRRWSEIDPSFPDKEINLYGPGTDSGTYDYFTKQVNGEEGVSRTDYMPSEDDNVLVEGVSGDKYAMAFFGYAYYAQNTERLKVIAIDDGNGCVAPTAETIQSTTYAPLSRPLYIYLNADSVQRIEVQEFMRYFIANAQWLSVDVGYVDSPLQTYLDDQTRLEAAIAGTGTPDSASGE